MLMASVSPVAPVRPRVRVIRGTQLWEVIATWRGVLRRVYTGTLGECVSYVYGADAHEAKSPGFRARAAEGSESDSVSAV